MNEAPEREFLEPEVLARLMRLPLQSRVPMEGGMSGQHKSLHRGSSVEFAEYRKYVPGDDIRRVDWRVYARSDRFYMKEFEADTNLRCYFVLDCSASMGFAGIRHAQTPAVFGTQAGREQSKLTFARRLIATLAYLIVQQGDAVGLLCFSKDTIHDIAPRRNAAHLKHIFDALAQVRPGGTTSLVQTLHDLAEKIRQRALVIIFSDFFTEVKPLLDCFQHLRFRKHDLAVFHLLDRTEVDFQFDRPIRFVDMESPFSLVAEPVMIRNRYLEELKRFFEELRNGCSEFKTDYRWVVTDQSYEKVLADFLMERMRVK